VQWIMKVSLLFEKTNNVLSIKKMIFKFIIECLVLTNHTKFWILKIKFVILMNIQQQMLLNSLNEYLKQFLKVWTEG